MVAAGGRYAGEEEHNVDGTLCGQFAHGNGEEPVVAAQARVDERMSRRTDRAAVGMDALIGVEADERKRRCAAVAGLEIVVADEGRFVSLRLRIGEFPDAGEVAASFDEGFVALADGDAHRIALLRCDRYRGFARGEEIGLRRYGDDGLRRGLERGSLFDTRHVEPGHAVVSYDTGCMGCNGEFLCTAAGPEIELRTVDRDIAARLPDGDFARCVFGGDPHGGFARSAVGVGIGRYGEFDLLARFA